MICKGGQSVGNQGLCDVSEPICAYTKLQRKRKDIARNIMKRGICKPSSVNCHRFNDIARGVIARADVER